MNTIITVIKTIIAFLPILRDLITSVETLFPAQGSGVQKLETIKAMIQATYETVQTVEAPFASVWPVLNSMITHLVPVFTAKSVAPVIADAAAQVDTTAAQVASLAKSPAVVASPFANNA